MSGYFSGSSAILNQAMFEKKRSDILASYSKFSLHFYKD